MRHSIWTTFGLGVLAGVLVTGALGLGVLKSIQQRGVTVRVETAPIAAQVEGEVREAVRREVPATLAALKQDLPARVAAETAQRLSQTTINLGGFSVPVPDAATQQVKAGVEQAVRVGLNVAVTDADMNALADRLAHRASGMVRDRMNQYLSGRTFAVEPWPGVKLPVSVVPE
jgi:hypothetical protein